MLVILEKDGLYYGNEKIQDERELMWRWNSSVEIKDGTTFGDLLNYLYDHEHITNVVSLLTQIDLLEYKDEFNKPEGELDLRVIEFIRSAYLQGNRLINRVEALGVFKEPRVNEELGISDRVCSLGFIPWSDLRALPLQINEDIQVWSDGFPQSMKTWITLGEMLTALFEELGFYGPPSKRDETAEDLRKQCEEMESGTLKTYSWEEVETRLKNRLEEKNATEK